MQISAWSTFCRRRHIFGLRTLSFTRYKMFSRRVKQYYIHFPLVSCRYGNLLQHHCGFVKGPQRCCKRTEIKTTQYIYKHSITRGKLNFIRILFISRLFLISIRSFPQQTISATTKRGRKLKQLWK